MKRLLLVRHGETAWNAAKVLQGQADIPLSAQGRQQALALAPLVQRWAPTHVISSDLSRARDTAALLGWKNAPEDARWREAHLGRWTSRPVKELLETEAEHYQRWRNGQEAPPDGETIMQFRTRVGAALDELHQHDGNVLVVTHGGVIRAVLAIVLGLEAEQIVAVDPGSLTMLDFSTNPRLLAYNNTPYVLEAQATD
ncbi:MAG: histidine phosphatase family protein [Lautropia sp.]|nr:histidine phosphatase family protein [Lautropia sp.]